MSLERRLNQSIFKDDHFALVDEDGQYKALFQLSSLTADRTYTLPDSSDTFALSTDISNLIDGTTLFTRIDINGGTVDGITSLTLANNVDIGNYTLTAKGLILSDDLSANDGDFTGYLNAGDSLELSPDVGFDDYTQWSGGTGWAITGSKGRFFDIAPATASLTMNGTMVIEVGKIYEITYTIAYIDLAMTLAPSIGGVALLSHSATGTYTQQITAISDAKLAFSAFIGDGVGIIQIDDASVKEVAEHTFKGITNIDGTFTDGTMSIVDGALSGVTTIASGDITVDADLVLSAGSITSVGGTIDFDNENLVTTGTINLAYLGKIDQNVFFGDAQTLSSLTNGLANLAIGENALEDLTDGDNNMCFGTNAGANITSGSENTCVGVGSGTGITVTSNNMFIGSFSGAALDGDGNVGIGLQSMLRIRAGSSNVSIGKNALFGAAGLNPHEINRNIAIGESAGFNIAHFANNNVLIGHRSGYSISGADNNVFVGAYSGYNQTATGSLLIIDNQNRGTAAAELTESLIYGVFNSTSPASQSLRINGEILGYYGANIGDGTNETQISSTGDLTFAGSAGLPYGIIAGDDQTIACTTLNTGYQVTFDECGDYNLTTCSTANDEIKIEKTGTYQIGIHFSAHCTTSNDFEICIKKNNGATDLFHCHAFITTLAGSKILGSSLTTIDGLTADDTIEVWVKCTDASNKSIIFDHVSLTVIMIGG